MVHHFHHLGMGIDENMNPCEPEDFGWKLILSNTGEVREINNDQTFSAFTVAELGEMLPKNMQFPIPQREGKGWCWRSEEGNHFVDTEADARAKMLVYLLENGLLTP